MTQQVRRAILVASALVVASTTPALATPGDDTLLAQFSYATVQATTGGLWECETGDAAGANLSFGYVEGDRLQNPIGSGRPSTWSDVSPFVEIFGCDGSYYGVKGDAFDLSGQYGSENVMIEAYEGAVLHVIVPLYQDGVETPIQAAFDVIWTAAGEPVVVDGGTGLTREAAASIGGTVAFSGFNELDPALGAALGNPAWDGTVAFPLEDATGVIGRRVANDGPATVPSTGPVTSVTWHRVDVHHDPPVREILACVAGDAWTCRFAQVAAPQYGFVTEGYRATFTGTDATAAWACPEWFPQAGCDSADTVIAGWADFTQRGADRGSAHQHMLIADDGGLWLYWTDRFVCPWFVTFDDALAAEGTCTFIPEGG